MTDILSSFSSIDYTTLAPMNNCPKCSYLWNKTDSKLFMAHLHEHIPKPVKKYAFTFTTNGNDVSVERDKLHNATVKLFTQQTVPIQEGGAWLEYTEAGRPHIHGWYTTIDGGRVFSKVFQRCWHLWGEKKGLTKFPGGFHEVMKTDRYIGYASAEGRLICSKVKDAEPTCASTNDAPL